MLALPHCHSRACFATALQRRGYGNCALPLSATGSGKAQFSNTSTRRLEKPCKTWLFENSILCSAKMPDGQAQAKKSLKGLF